MKTVHFHDGTVVKSLHERWRRACRRWAKCAVSSTRGGHVHTFREIDASFIFFENKKPTRGAFIFEISIRSYVPRSANTVDIGKRLKKKRKPMATSTSICIYAAKKSGCEQ